MAESIPTAVSISITSDIMQKPAPTAPASPTAAPRTASSRLQSARTAGRHRTAPSRPSGVADTAAVDTVTATRSSLENAARRRLNLTEA